MRRLTYMKIKYMHFEIYQGKWKHWKEKIGKYFDIVAFFKKKFMIKQRITLLSNSCLSRKIFHPHPYYQIRGSQCPFVKGVLNYAVYIGMVKIIQCGQIGVPEVVEEFKILLK